MRKMAVRSTLCVCVCVCVCSYVVRGCTCPADKPCLLINYFWVVKIVVGKETRAGFNLKTWKDNGGEGSGLECWGPVINMNRDPRWGRNAEGGAECPYLMGELGIAWTKGVGY